MKMLNGAQKICFNVLAHIVEGISVQKIMQYFGMSLISEQQGRA